MHFFAYLAGLCLVKISSGADVYYPRDVVADSEVRIGLQTLLRGHNSSLAQVYNEKTLKRIIGRPDLFTLTLCGARQTQGRQGMDVNQDRAFVLQNGRLKVSAVLDGHGGLGHHVAEFARNAIVEKLLKWNNFENLAHPIVASFIENLLVSVDKELPDELAMQGGTTVSMVLQLGSHVYMVNVGDSRSFLVSGFAPGKETKVLALTRVDMPHLPEEKERLEKSGGKVTLPSEKDVISRVWYQFITDPQKGETKPLGLAQSRGIGYRQWRGVVANPVIHVYKVSDLVRNAQECPVAKADCGMDEPVRIIAVSATDGMAMFVNETVIADVLLKRDSHVFNGAQHLLHSAVNVWETTLKGHPRDDMAIAVFEIEQTVTEIIADA